MTSRSAASHPHQRLARSDRCVVVAAMLASATARQPACIHLTRHNNKNSTGVKLARTETTEQPWLRSSLSYLEEEGAALSPPQFIESTILYLRLEMGKIVDHKWKNMKMRFYNTSRERLKLN